MPTTQTVTVGNQSKEETTQGSDGESVPVFTLAPLIAEHIAAEDVSAEQLNSLISDISLAAENGDAELAKQAKSITAKAKRNARQNPHYAAASSESSDNDNEENIGGDAASRSVVDAGQQSSGSGNSAPVADPTPVPDSSPDPEPVHVHTWVQCSEIVGYEADVVCSCGQHFSSVSEWNSHSRSNLLAGNNGHGSYSVNDIPIYSYYERCSGCGATR